MLLTRLPFRFVSSLLLFFITRLHLDGIAIGIDLLLNGIAIGINLLLNGIAIGIDLLLDGIAIGIDLLLNGIAIGIDLLLDGSSILFTVETTAEVAAVLLGLSDKGVLLGSDGFGGKYAAASHECGDKRLLHNNVNFKLQTEKLLIGATNY